MEPLFTIYVADSKGTNSAGSTRLTDFNGLSLGEVRSFLSDLIERDIKKGYLNFLASAPQLSPLRQAADVQSSTETAALRTTKALSKDATDAVYDRMSQHDILTTVWAFSDKTLIIVKS